MDNKHISRYSNQKEKIDEYYTTKEEVEHIIKDMIGHEYFHNKKIYCPCDSDESEFTKYFKEHKDELKYEDFINTCDDMFSHEDLFLWADTVITNEPFSRKIELFKWTCKLLDIRHFDYFYFTGTANFGEKYLKDVKYYRAYKNYEKFIVPFESYVNKGKNFCKVPHVYVTNIQGVKGDYKAPVLTKKMSDIEPVWFKEAGGAEGLNVDFIRDIPVDWDGLICVPVTGLLEQNMELYDDMTHLQSTMGGDRFTFSDGKSRFKRYIVKLKNVKKC